MDNSKEFNLMLDRAIAGEPLGFKDFDRTKNVQDQLQEMVKEGNKFSYTNNLVLAGKFDKFCSWQANDITSLDWSMEQLWLAFVMKEKYNKVWNNNNWRKE